jgi:threonine dehydrogenase-like Zn-dependent dehydrogenase
MRGGAQIGCLINPVAGHELEYTESSPPRGRDICVIGAGPAGLCYAQLAADGNKVTVIEREPVAGGALRLAAKAPAFQEVETREACFQVYLAEMERACREAGVEFRYGVDITGHPEMLEPFELIVFATGARYGYGLGALAPRLLASGLGRTTLARRLFASQGLKNWFYYRARTGTGAGMLKLTRPGQEVVVIGDAARAGKGGEAISDAFRAALFGQGRRAVSRKS